MKNEIEMMRVLRIPPMGKLVIEANEERYSNLVEVTNPKIRQRILAAIGELVDFCGGYAVLEDGGVVPHLTPPPPRQVEDAEVSSLSPELQKQQEAFLANLQRRVEEEKSKPQRKAAPNMDAKPLVEITETGDVKPAAIAPKQLSIAEQIDRILQKYIEADPTMANRGIRLEQNPTGGLQILADGKSYEKPADIEDVAVRGMIKAAVREWNATQ